MSGIPVVVSAHGGMSVKSVASGAPVMNVAANGLGIPIVLSDKGVPFVVQGTTPPSPMTSIAAEGWKGVMATPADLSFAPITVSRQGYDSSGIATTITDTLYTTKRIRQPYPNQAVLTTADVALNDYIYSTDTISGTINNSTEVSPKPIGQWAVVDRRVVGNFLTVQLVAAHRDGRNGKPVAAITGTATDGTTTVTALTSTPIVVVHPQDRQPVIGYELTFDITTLADNTAITVNAKVYPHLGAAASILDSASGTADTRGFRPLVFLKSTSKFANPPYVYVDATLGIDATVDANGQAAGITKVSTTAATAALAPFQTPASAANALRAATNITGGFSTGCIMRIVGTVVWGASWTSATYQNGACMYVEGVDGSAAITTGSVNTATRQPFMWYRNININRTGGTQSMGSGSTWTVLENVNMNNGSQTGALFSTSFHLIGVVLTNSSGTVIANSTAGCWLVRGLQTANATAVDTFCVLGCNLTGNGALTFNSTRTASNGYVGFNKIMNIGSASGARLDLTVTENVVGFALIQNVFEWITTDNQPAIRLAGDGGTGNLTHMVCEYNSVAGAGDRGRMNWLYDDTTTPVYRVHKLSRFRGNVVPQINNKSDLFTNDGLHVGNWHYYFGSGCLGNFSMYIDAAGAGPDGSFAQKYPGLKASIGTSAVTKNDPLFTNNQSVTLPGPVAGAGNGDYTLQSGSPCIGVLTAAEESLPLDLAGNTRDRGSLGAYR